MEALAEGSKKPVLVLESGNVYVGSDLWIEEVSLNVIPGEVLGIWGTNGCGKTTLLKVIAGVQDSGPPGLPACRRVADADLRVGYLPQEPMVALLPWFRCCENLRLHAHGGLSKEDARARLEKELGFVDDRWKLHPHQLSGGYKQRLAWACATLPGLGLIALDEAFGHQDATWVPRLLAEIRELAKKGCAIVLVTHDPELLVLASERIAILRRSSGITRLTRIISVVLERRDLGRLREEALKDYVATLGEHLYSE